MLGGLLVYIVPYYRLTPDICNILAENFSDLSVWKFTDGEFARIPSGGRAGASEEANGGRRNG